MNYRKSEAKEAARAQFRGVWAAIPTPFTPDLQVDEAGLRHNMRHLTGNLKIEGVFCTGVMGEFWSLTKEERKRCVEIVVEEAKRGGCKVIAHTAHHSAHETVELTLHAQNVGADFVILMNQYYPPASDQTMYEWFKFVADRVDIGLWMFDAEYSGFGMSPEVTARTCPTCSRLPVTTCLRTGTAGLKSIPRQRRSLAWPGLPFTSSATTLPPGLSMRSSGTRLRM